MLTTNLISTDSIIKEFANFPEQAKVWVYQADRTLSPNEQTEIAQELKLFTTNWTAHDQQLTASSKILFNSFIVLIVDEAQTNASGCSIDKAFKMISTLGNKLSINFLDRMNFNYLDNDILKMSSPNKISQLIATNTLTTDSLVFDNTITTVAQLKKYWLIPAGTTWLSRYF